MVEFLSTYLELERNLHIVLVDESILQELCLPERRLESHDQIFCKTLDILDPGLLGIEKALTNVRKLLQALAHSYFDLLGLLTV